MHSIFLLSRSLSRDKFFSFLNIAGLTMGITLFLLIAQYIRFEKSYEHFIPERDQIYRIGSKTFHDHQKKIIPMIAESSPFSCL